MVLTSYVYSLLYVDGMLIACKSISEINKVKTQLSGEFEMNNLGLTKKNHWRGDHLRTRSEKIVFISKEQLIKKDLSHFFLELCSYVW